MPRNTLLAICLAVVLWPSLVFSSDQDGLAEIPFTPGEQLTYQLRWLFIPAGEAKLEVLPMTDVDGHQAYHFRLTVRSTPFIDNFYMVRDKVEAWTDTALTRSLHYRKNQHEGPTRHNVHVFFDWHQRQARYETETEIRKPIAIRSGTLDPLSVLFYARLFDLTEVLQVEKPVTDGKICVIGKGNVMRREQITLSNGNRYDTVLIEPQMKHIGGVFEKSPGAKIKIWLTADERRIPVKVESAVSVGHFTGELISDYPSFAARMQEPERLN